MKFADFIGLAAGFMTSFGFIPQIIKSFATKKINDVALWQPALLALGMTMWFVYGLLTSQPAVIITNAFAVICNLVILGMKFAYRGNR